MITVCIECGLAKFDDEEHLCSACQEDLLDLVPEEPDHWPDDALPFAEVDE